MPRGIYLHKKHTEETKKKISLGHTGLIYHGLTLQQRFWSKVGINDLFDCWEYQENKDDKGYGIFKCKNKSWYAHRFAWFIIHGQIPNDKCVCHKCDNPPCCNPAHLFLATHKENMEDMAKKGRAKSQIGENSHLSKLTEKDIILIRSLHEKGSTRIRLAQQFNVTMSNIWQITERKTWRHI